MHVVQPRSPHSISVFLLVTEPWLTFVVCLLPVTFFSIFTFLLCKSCPFFSYPFPFVSQFNTATKLLFCSISFFIFMKNLFLANLFWHIYQFSNLIISRICKHNVKLKSSMLREQLLEIRSMGFSLGNNPSSILYLKNSHGIWKSWDYKVPKQPLSSPCKQEWHLFFPHIGECCCTYKCALFS